MALSVFGSPGLEIEKSQNFGPSSNDWGTLAYIPSGEAEFEVNCGYLNENSIVLVQATSAASGTIKLIEIHYTSLAASRRTLGKNGKFWVGTQDASVTAADVYFNWKVIGI